MEPLWTPRTDTAARLLGAAFLAAGAAILYWQLWLPVQAAKAHAPSVSYSLKLLVLGELFAVLGAWWTVRGLPAYEATRNFRSKGKVVTLVLVVVAAAAALASMWYLNTTLRAFGYDA